MTTTLAKTDSRALVAQAQLTAMQEQVLRTVPGAKDAPLEVILGACILAHTLNLNIAAGEVYIGTFGSVKDEATQKWVKQYSYGVGVKGARVLADREARWQVDYRTLEPDEAARLRGPDYDPGDIGVEATLVRYDDAMMAQRAGVKYQPRKAVGWYRVKARFNSYKKEWVSDQIPNTWTAQDVAEKRAEVSVLKKAFSWGSKADVRLVDPAMFDNATVDGDYIDAGAPQAAMQQVAAKMLDDARRTMTAPASDATIDEDGYIVDSKEERARASAATEAAAAKRLQAEAQQPKEQAPGVKGLALDWSSGVWDEYIILAVEGSWKPLEDGPAAKLSSHLRTGKGEPVSDDDWRLLKEAWDSLLGEYGAVPVLAALCGWGNREQVPAEAAGYLLGMAAGRYVNARNVLMQFAADLHASALGNAGDIPFGDEEG
jgi:hypothetical protein